MKKPSETCDFEVSELKITQIHVIKWPGGPLKPKMRRLAHIQTIAGVLRDILTKFQEIRSTRSEYFCVLLYFW